MVANRYKIDIAYSDAEKSDLSAFYAKCCPET